jgi:hypothetical protein
VKTTAAVKLVGRVVELEPENKEANSAALLSAREGALYASNVEFKESVAD